MGNKLNKKEQDFCINYINVRNSTEAALLAGFTVLPRKTGERLLTNKSIRNEIIRLESENQALKNEALAGFRRLAFGSIGDAVKLVTGQAENIDNLDLFMVSDIKMPKGGGMEIKFYDRQKALESLAQLENYSENNSAIPFYKALEKSAEFISTLRDDLNNEQ